MEYGNEMLISLLEYFFLIGRVSNDEFYVIFVIKRIATDITDDYHIWSVLFTRQWSECLRKSSASQSEERS